MRRQGPPKGVRGILKLSNDYKYSAAAVANATDVLGVYYRPASFVQVVARRAMALGGAKDNVRSEFLYANSSE